MNIRVLYALAATILVCGCADKKDDDYILREQEAMDAWMAENHPEAERMENGMYVEWLRRTNAATVTPRVGLDWVSVDYLVRDLEDNIMGTRSREVAEDEGTYTRVTHYVPDFAELKPEQRYFSPGEYAILPEMKITDSVRLYLPSNLAYISANIVFANGYEGWRYNINNPVNAELGVPSGGRAVIIDLALRDIISDPKAVETAQVEELGETMESFPEGPEGLFYEIISEDTEAEIILQDEDVWVSYECRFLDGQLVATNKGEVAFAEWGDPFDKYPDVGKFKATGSSPMPGTAFNELVQNNMVRYNSTVRMVFTSDFGYGSVGATSRSSAGSQAPRPVVFPYTPLVMEVITKSKDYEN